MSPGVSARSVVAMAGGWPAARPIRTSGLSVMSGRNPGKPLQLGRLSDGLPYPGPVTSRQVVVVGYDGAELVDIACVTSALTLANRLGAHPRYEVALATVGGRDIVCESGLQLAAQRDLAAVQSVDTLIISGGDGISPPRPTRC